jgi:hypothetical protein
MISGERTTAVASSMACGAQACRGTGGDALAGLARFRQEFRWCLWRRGDALFELADAVLTAGTAGPLPYLSLEPAFRRGHGMVYQSLARGRIDEEALRDLLVRWRPREWPLAFAIDASTYPRPWAATSPGREWHHHCCPGNHGSDGAAVAGGRSSGWPSSRHRADAPRKMAVLLCGPSQGGGRIPCPLALSRAARARSSGSGRHR